MQVLCVGGKCCSPVMCISICDASSSSSQTVAVSGPFRPVTSSAPFVIGEAVATKKCPHFCEGELCGVYSPSISEAGMESLFLFVVGTIL